MNIFELLADNTINEVRNNIATYNSKEELANACPLCMKIIEFIYSDGNIMIFTTNNGTLDKKSELTIFRDVFAIFEAIEELEDVASLFNNDKSAWNKTYIIPLNNRYIYYEPYWNRIVFTIVLIILKTRTIDTVDYISLKGRLESRVKHSYPFSDYILSAIYTEEELSAFMNRLETFVDKLANHPNEDEEGILSRKGKDGKTVTKVISARMVSDIVKQYDYKKGLNKKLMAEMLSKITGLQQTSFNIFLVDD